MRPNLLSPDRPSELLDDPCAHVPVDFQNSSARNKFVDQSRILDCRDDAISHASERRRRRQNCQETESHHRHCRSQDARKDARIQTFRAVQSKQDSRYMRYRTQSLIFADCRISLAYDSTFHQRTSWKDHLPAHHLSRTKPADIRLAKRTESGFHYPSTDPRTHHSQHSMERLGLCRMGWCRSRLFKRCMGLQARKEDG